MAHTTARLAGWLAALCAFVFAAPAGALTGTLDPTFGAVGYTQWSHSDDKLVAMARHADGRIILAGTGTRDGVSYLFTARTTIFGDIDVTFGGSVGGRVVVALPYATAAITSVTIDGSGRYVYAGYENSGSGDLPIAVMLDANGFPVTTFGATSNGISQFGGLGSGPGGRRVTATTWDGTGILVASSIGTGVNREIFINRLTATGAVSAAFGVVGSASTTFNMLAEVYAMGIDPTGRIVVAGSCDNGTSVDTCVARFTGAGALDTTFNAGVTPGHLRVDAGGLGLTDRANAIAFYADSRIVLAGQAGTQGYVMRITAAGLADATFGTGGAQTAFSAPTTFNSVAVGADGRILAVGTVPTSPISSRYVALLLPSGALDNSFNGNGTETTAVAGRQENNAVSVLTAPGVYLIGTREGNTGDYLFRVEQRDATTLAKVSFSCCQEAVLDVSSVQAHNGGIAMQGANYILAGDAADVSSYRFTAARVLPNGTLDPTFGTNGRVWLAAQGHMHAVVVDASQRIVIVGENIAGPRITVVRLLPNGAPDPSFGTGGTVTLDPTGQFSGANAVAIQPDGRILLAGQAFVSATISGYFVARLTTSGALDATFGSGGFVVSGSPPAAAYGMVLQPDGKVVISGSSLGSGFLLRLSSTGVPDATFGTSGRLLVNNPFGTSVSLSGIALQSDGRIVVAGSTQVPPANTQLLVARVTTAGVLDASFAINGIATASFGQTTTVGGVIAIEGNGRIVVGGSQSGGAGSNGYATRFLSNGLVDPSYGVQGVNIDGNQASTNGVVIESPSGRATFSGDGPGQISSVKRLLGGSLPLELVMTPPSLNYPGLAVGASIPGPNFAVYNTGDLDLTISAIDIVGANPADFIVGNTNCGPLPFLMPPGGVCAALIAFQPTGVGPRAATLRVFSNVPASPATGGMTTVGFDSVPDAFAFTPQMAVATGSVRTSNAVAITGLAVPSPLFVTGGSYSIGCTGTFTTANALINNGQTVCVQHTASATPGVAVTTTLTIGLMAVPFTSTTLGNPSSVASLSGAGQSAAIGAAFGTALSVRVVDPFSTPLSGVTVNFTAPAFAPTAILSPASAVTDINGVATVNATASGYFGNYNVTASVAGVPPITIALTNIGSDASLSATQVAFGNHNINTTTNANAITLANLGNVAMTVGSIAVAGNGFTMSHNCPANIAIGGTCTVNVAFTPTTEGPRTGTVTIVTSGVFTPYRILLAGTGTDLANPNGDADGDGVPNGVEPSVNLNPLSKDNDIFNQPRLFGMQQYRDFLGREGDSAGIDYYIMLLNTGAAVRANIIESFFGSPEFQGVGSPVARLYFATFLRIPDYAGLQFQINVFRGGTPLSVIANNFTLSPEFLATYGALDNTQYVTLLYQNILGRTPVQAEIDFHVNRLVSGASRGDVLVGFSESPEYQASTYNDVYVTMMYVGMLRRAPEQAGFDYWTNYMDTGNSGLALISGFLNAPEYHDRFLP